MDKLKVLMLAGALALVSASGASASGFFTNGVPTAGGTQYPSTIPLTGNEQIPADTELTSGQNPQSEAITTNQLAAFGNSQPSRNNMLIGGDATTNLWQRGTTGSSVTTTLTYGGPDRWAYWSGTNTAMTVGRDSTASDIPTGYKYAFKMARTSSQTGVVQMCMAQEVESVNSYQAAGQTVELDFHAYTGANFSAANANMTAYIVYGTGTDEGLAGSNSLAYGLNAGGGGSGAWTGQTNATAAVINLGGVSTAGRYSAVANVPATATEVAVVLCYTPVGTAGTNDYVAFSGIQLIRNPAVAAYASSTVGYTASSIGAAAFERRSQQQETALQQRYFWELAEPAAGVVVATGSAITTAYCVVNLNTPTTMRIAPTLTFGTLSNTTWELFSASATPIALATTYLVQNAFGANTPNVIGIKATGATTPFTAGNGCTLAGAGGTGSYIAASAEL